MHCAEYNLEKELQGNRSISGHNLVIGVPSAPRFNVTRYVVGQGLSRIKANGPAQDGEQRLLVLHRLGGVIHPTLLPAEQEQEWDCSQ